MTSAEMIPAVILKRKAVVYVRQSTQSQVMTNLEGKRRQYDLVDVARQHGFVDVEIIDATFVEVPRQRNSRDDNETIKKGEVPADWNDKKKAHKCTAARF